MTEDNWKLLRKNGALAHYERKYRVEIDDRKMYTDDKFLILSGHKEPANIVLKLLRRPIDEQVLDGTPKKLPLPTPNKPTVTISEETWKLLDEYSALTGYGKGLQVDVTARRIPTGQWELTLSGPKAAVARVCGWLQHAPRKLELSAGVPAWLVAHGPSGARIDIVSKKANVHIQLSSDKRSALLTGSPSGIDVAVSIMKGLHKECFEIETATARWLTNKRKGAEDARAREFDAEFDSFLNFTSDPGADTAKHTIGVVILGENDDFVRAYRRTLEATVVEKVNVTRLQLEFWYGHDREETRDRPLHRLEDSTGTNFLRDDEAGLLHVAGRPQGVNEAVEHINNTRHIKLFVGKISSAMANYIALIRHHYEKDGVLQIHLAYNDYATCGFVEFRRLHRMNSEKDEDQALADDDDLMRKLERHEVVVEVPAWTRFMVKDCRKLEETIVTGIGFSNDAVKGRVLVDIAGSRSTVKRGMEEVIGRITNDPRYKEGDICLRRIQGQPVDIAGFKKMQDAKPLNLSRCTQPYSWERLTPERWCYVGEPSAGSRPDGLR